MEDFKKHSVWGYLLIGIGIILLIGNMSRFGMEVLWPIFPFSVGIAFFISYFMQKKDVGLLMPGSILCVISLLFFYCTISGWQHMETLWPIFIMAPAVGFIVLYLFGNRDSSFLIPAVILFCVGAIFLMLSYGFGDFWPVFLIVAGIVLIFLARKTSGQPKTSSE